MSELSKSEAWHNAPNLKTNKLNVFFLKKKEGRGFLKETKKSFSLA